jgi:hypothetical protein
MDETASSGRKAARASLVVVFVCAALTIAGLASFGVAVYLKDATATENCEAIVDNNDILRDLVEHVEKRSIRSIETGVTKDLTVKDVEGFYGPTLDRIDSVSC